MTKENAGAVLWRSVYLVFVFGKKNFLVTFFIGVYVYILLASQMDSTASVADFLTFLFLGVHPMHIDSFTILEIPYHWLLVFLYFFFCITYLSSFNREALDKKIFISSSKRVYWWSAKYVSMIVQLVAHFLILFLVGVFLTLVLSRGSVQLFLSEEFKQAFIIEEPYFKSEADIYFHAFLLPVLATLAIGSCVLYASLFFSKFISFIGVTVFLIISAFFTNNLLLGNYLMVLKNDRIVPTGVNAIWGIYLSGFVLFLIFIFGAARIKKLDYL